MMMTSCPSYLVATSRGDIASIEAFETFCGEDANGESP
jgi:hypothetical protein